MARFREDYTSNQLAGGRTFRSANGTIYSVQTQPGIPATYWNGWDTVHSGPPFVDESNLDMTRTTIKRRMSLTVSGSNTGTRRSENYDFRPLQANSHQFLGPFGSQAYVNQALASLNPNNPIVDLPLFLFELREFPSLIRALGLPIGRRDRWIEGRYGVVSTGRRSVPHNVASGYLSYKFGWAPLFSDLGKLVTLGQQIEDERQHLENIARNKKASGRLDNFTTSWNSGNHLIRINPYEDLRIHDAFTGTREVWFSARVQPDFSNPYFGENRFGEVSRVLGLNLSASTIWNMIPWTWLIDYFISVGSYFEATRGVLPFSISNMNIMCRDLVRKEQVEFYSNMPSYQYTSGIKESERKRRVVHVIPKARIAFEPNPLVGRVGILTSLAVAKLF